MIVERNYYYIIRIQQDSVKESRGQSVDKYRINEGRGVWMIETDAWVLTDSKKWTKFIKKKIIIKEIMNDEVLVTPLYGCLEGNMVHALMSEPENIFNLRKEDEIILGNAGVVRVEKVGENVRNLASGDLCIYFCNGESDEFGYPKKITAYDKRGSYGVLAKKIKLTAKELIKIPENSGISLQQWAAFSLKYPTAWSNWKVAYNCWKIQMENVLSEDTFVFGWGGGVTYAELELANLFGCKCFMMTSKKERIELLKKHGITGVDRNYFCNDTHGKKFIEYVKEITNGKGASIFIDNIGQPVYKLSLKALGRQGILASSGWKMGGMLPLLRQIECQNRHVHVFTHFARYEEGVEAVRFAIEKGWFPEKNMPEYTWEEIPEIIEKYSKGEIVDYFPVYKINS